MTKRPSRTRPATRPAAAHVVYTTPLVKKLGVKPEMMVALLSSPKGFSGTLEPQFPTSSGIRDQGSGIRD